MERAFGTDLDDVRVHEDVEGAALADSQSASAVTWGSHIAFGRNKLRPGEVFGDLLLAHEVAHTIEQGGGGQSGTHAPVEGRAAEDNADRAAVGAVGRDHGSALAPAAQAIAHGGLSLRRCGGRRKRLEEALTGERAWTPELASSGFEAYRSLSDSERQELFRRYYARGTVRSMLRALPSSDRDNYNVEIQDILQRAQRSAVLETAQAGGLRDEGAIVQAQADFMRQRNEAAAQAALPANAPPPTAAQIAGRHAQQVDETSIPNTTTTMSPADVADWTRRANAVVPRVLSYGRANYPEMVITARDVVVNILGVHQRGEGVIALGPAPGQPRVAEIGRPFVQLAEANPAYAFDVLVHELHGHPEYGPPGSELSMELYDRAAARMPGYVTPTDPTERSNEYDAYGYQETEIYSLLRQMPYNVPLAPAHAALSFHPDPEVWIRNRIASLRRQWLHPIAIALLRGMTVRYRLDPRLTPQALAMYERALRANFTSEPEIADRILRR